MNEILQSDIKESIFDDSFLESSGYLWDRKIYDKIFRSFDTFRENNIEGITQEKFKTLLLEIRMSRKEFLQKVKDLDIVMQCRNKADNDSHFGGQECAEFAKCIRSSCEKYLADLKSENIKKETLEYFIKKIRDKAKNDEAYAWNVEKNFRQTYIIEGKDNTMQILKNI